MYLKQIALVGFKSFADRVALNFDQRNITGVVGPNGSGKSNVIDAVRWVMGEQNTKLLRGEKATDIIFSGSEKRKPLGMAEVTLVFDNKEAGSHCPEEYRYEEEIALTRRLYLDGQRELFINRKSCRLRDIVNFFIDSGVGGRSYSMIQQGQVDRILQAKPEQLREIVEEAAGIVVFKKRNEETRKKLEQVQQNLSRLEDIEKEVETRASALEEQAMKAKKWQEYTAKLHEKENNYYCQYFLQQDHKRKGLIETIETEKLAQIKLGSDISAFEKELEEKKAQLAEKDPEFAIINEEIAKVREKLASSETELVGVLAKDDIGEKRLKNLDLEIKEEKDNFKEVNLQNSKLEKEFKDAEDLTKNAESRVESFQDRIDNYSEQTLVKDNLIEESIKNISDVEKSLDAAKLRAENVTEQFQEYTQEKQNYTKKLSSLESDYSQFSILVDSSKVKVKNKEKELNQKIIQENKLKEKILSNSESQEKIKSILERSKQKYIEVSTRLNFYKNRKHWVQEISSCLSTLEEDKAEQVITLSHQVNLDKKKTEKITEEAKISFEKWSERLFLRDPELLIELEEVLRDKNFGPIPVTLFHEGIILSEEDQKWITKQKLVSISDFIKKDSCSEELLSWMSSHVYFSNKDFLTEEELLEKPSEIIVISQKAVIYVNNCDLQLGISTEDTFLTMEREKEELELQSEKYVERIQEEKQKLDSLKDKGKKLELDLVAMADDIHTQKQEHLQRLGDEQKHMQHANLTQETIQTLRNDFQEKMKKNQAFENDKNDLEASIKTLTVKKKDLERHLSDLRESKLDMQESLEEIRKQLEEFRYEKVSAETKLQTFESSRKQNKQQIDSFKSRLEKLTETFSYTENEHLENKERKSRLEEDLVSLNAQKEKLETLLSNKKSENTLLTQAIKKVDEQVKKLQQNGIKITARIQEKKITLEKVEMQIISIKEQALEKCKIEDFSSLTIEKEESFNPQNATKQLSNLRARIEDLGLINMVAVEEYDELSKRKEFIQTQKHEVEAAIGLLELAIDEITENSEKKFIIAYDRLNQEFQELFPILFPRGKGELILTNKEKPLESGVEIMVRLPGKARQSMRLFSGGEKALTAIALIFALLKSKPTPFCFLDEVDAALDETNVGHYNRLLESLSDRFQFIVITHRRKTMEVLDNLYGVTMQEPGVSKVVGVDLSKSLPAHLQKAFKEKELPKLTPKEQKPSFDI